MPINLTLEVWGPLMVELVPPKRRLQNCPTFSTFTVLTEPLLCVCVLFSSPPPKIVFNRLNGKRYHSTATQKAQSPAEGFTPAHEENVRFVYEGEGHRINTWV